MNQTIQNKREKCYVWDATIFNYKTIQSIFFLKYILIFSSCVTHINIIKFIKIIFFALIIIIYAFLWT